jgi:MFS family permease
MFKETYSHTLAVVFTFLVGVTNCISVLLSMFTVDKLGRKTLTTIGAIGLFLTDLAYAILIQTGYANDYYSGLIAILVFLVFFELGLGGVMWVYNAEITNSKGVTISTVLNW